MSEQQRVPLRESRRKTVSNALLVALFFLILDIAVIAAFGIAVVKSERQQGENT